MYKDLTSEATKAALKKSRDNWYKNNKEKQIKNQAEKKDQVRKWLTEYKRELKCQDCNVLFINNPEWLDFHHLDPGTKDLDVACLISYGKERILKEIKKCVPLCANCHRTRHKNDIYRSA